MADDNNVNVYGLTPNYNCNLAALILFTILWAYHTGMFIYKQWWFSIAWWIGAGLEVAGYVGRFKSSSDPYYLDYFLVQIVCLTIAPAFIMGGVYYLLAKFAMIYGEEISRLKPMWYSYIFITCDLLSIVLQAIGGGMAAVALTDNKETDTGTHIMVAGLAVQVAAMSVFFILCTDFVMRIRTYTKNSIAERPELASLSPEELDHELFNPKYAHIRNNKPLYPAFIGAIVFCSLCIFVRCIYRLIELAEGWDGYLILHERYFLVLEALIVFLGMLSLSIIHPGVAFDGRSTSIPVKGLHKEKHHESEDLSNLEKNNDTIDFQ